MKLTKSKLKEIIKEELKSVNEARTVTKMDADNFISDVLKLGSKNNLFDSFMKREGISQDQLFSLVSLVTDQLKNKWL